MNVGRRVSSWICVACALAAAGCAITNYPVITDTRGADSEAVVVSLYDKAYIVPSYTAATLWDDGSDEMYTVVQQDWKGDQWLETYCNFDPTATVIFLDQLYCDPARQTDCRELLAWNPNLPEAYPGDPNAQSADFDDPFDYEEYNWNCPGARSECVLLSYDSRIGECGSGIWADKQNAAYEFSRLEKVDYRGGEYYHLPIDISNSSFALTDGAGQSTTMPVFGRYNVYLDEQLRAIVPVTANARYQLRWLKAWTANHGQRADLDVTYGSLTASFKVKLHNLEGAAARL